MNQTKESDENRKRKSELNPKGNPLEKDANRSQALFLMGKICPVVSCHALNDLLHRGKFHPDGFLDLLAGEVSFTECCPHMF